jgi:hypothetical protein
MKHPVVAAMLVSGMLATPTQAETTSGVAGGSCINSLSSPVAQAAYATGLLGVSYGYPLVDLLAQMHNETHHLAGGQQVFAPLNDYYRFRELLTPSTQGNLRAPNADTLYLNAWVDLRTGPVVLHVPDTADRYYTLALMDLYSLPVHIGRRTTGTREGRYALVPPGWKGKLPRGVQRFPVATNRMWILGRLLVNGAEDLPAARALLDRFTIETLDGSPAARPVAPVEMAPLRPHGTLDFFSVLNEALRLLPVPPAEAALLAQFDRLGFGPGTQFKPAELPAAAREGLACATATGGAVIAATGFRATSVRDGWILASNIAQPGFDYPLRAAVARGGYINDPAEAMYPAAATDSTGVRLDGQYRYRLRFAPGMLPPVDAFWSITPYESSGFKLVENPLGRYAIGDRTPGLRFGEDGSLEIILAHSPPAAGTANWLPIPAGPFHVVARLYQPRPAALAGTWSMPPLERLP